MHANLEPHVRAREAELRYHHPGLTACRVHVADRPPHRYECRRFNVRLDLEFAGRELVINREHDDDPRVALHDAFAAAGRQLHALERAVRRYHQG